MTSRERDRRAEYQRRIAKAEAEGRSPAEGRGHGRVGIRRSGARQVLGLPEREREARSRVHEALSIARQHPHRSLSWASRQAGTTVDAVARHAPNAIERQPSGRYRVKPADREVRVMPVISGGVVYPRVAIRGSRQASLVGEHLSAIATYLGTGDGKPLRRLAGKSVTGTLPDGRSYRFELETNLDEIAELAFYGELSDLVVES
ncbi:MAG: hypothetical protein ABSF89_15120 [Acidimicrobiales bacterium]